MISMAENSDNNANHGPDDLMDIPIPDLARLIVQRSRQLRKLERMHALPCCIRKEKQRLRIAETAARARVREMARYVLNLLDE